MNTAKLILSTSLLACIVSTASAYQGSVTQWYADIKRPLDGTGAQITPTNRTAILNGFKNRMRANGLRFVISRTTDLNHYNGNYTDTLVAARSSTYNFGIYANHREAAPLLPASLQDKTAYVNWIAAYANKFKPNYLGLFNEPDNQWTATEIIDIARRIKALLTYSPTYVGPDMWQASTLTNAIRDTAIEGEFNIIGYHTLGSNNTANALWWKNLKTSVGKSCWSSENARYWTETSSGGKQIGVNQCVSGLCTGIVKFTAFPNMITETGGIVDTAQKTIITGVTGVANP